MGLLEGAASAIAEASSLKESVTTQVDMAARTLNVLSSQLTTGKNPAYKINPPTKNDPSQYEEDNTAIARGGQLHLVELLGFLKDGLQDVIDNSAKKVEESEMDSDYLETGDDKLATRVAKSLTDISRSLASTNLQKGQGHTVEKTAETLVKLAKSVYTQAGSTIYNEAPFIVNTARLVTNRGVQIFNEATDIFTKADNYISRVNTAVLTAQKVYQLVAEDNIIAVGGTVKLLQNDSGKDTIIQAGRDLGLKALNGKVLVQAKTDVDIQANGALKMKGDSSAKLESASTIDITAGANLNMGSAAITNIAGVIVNIGTSAPTAPSTNSDPVEESESPVDITQIPLEISDKKPAILVETRIGLNPPGVLPRRSNKKDEKNR
jgi:hypothetical protein